MGLAQVTISATPGGGKVVVDGVDLSGVVQAVQLNGAAHQVPQVILQLMATADVSALADVVAVRQQDVDGEAIAGFLSAIDPEQLEKDVLEGMGLLQGDGETSFTAALLKRLAVIAKGAW